MLFTHKKISRAKSILLTSLHYFNKLIYVVSQHQNCHFNMFIAFLSGFLSQESFFCCCSWTINNILSTNVLFCGCRNFDTSVGFTNSSVLGIFNKAALHLFPRSLKVSKLSRRSKINFFYTSIKLMFSLHFKKHKCLW